ncbi:MAG TPA: hypothetical protein VHG71_02780 [Verrucomicrobiae bacterium]|nr:hypothetical protein [Verrucomicrobiae bacterium]
MFQSEPEHDPADDQKSFAEQTVESDQQRLEMIERRGQYQCQCQYQDPDSQRQPTGATDVQGGLAVFFNLLPAKFMQGDLAGTFQFGCDSLQSQLHNQFDWAG